MADGLWPMAYGLLPIAYCLLPIAYGLLPMARLCERANARFAAPLARFGSGNEIG
jgi:hypothetical protein